MSGGPQTPITIAADDLITPSDLLSTCTHLYIEIQSHTYNLNKIYILKGFNGGLRIQLSW